MKKGLRFIGLHIDIQVHWHRVLSLFKKSMNYFSVFLKSDCQREGGWCWEEVGEDKVSINGDKGRLDLG